MFRSLDGLGVGNGNCETAILATETTSGFEGGQYLSEALVADTECGPQVGPGHGRVDEGGDDPVTKWVRLLLGVLLGVLDNCQMRVGLGS